MFPDELLKNDFSLKNPFVPLTTFKAILIIVILGFIVFGNMLSNGFAVDDYEYILDNPLVHQFSIPRSFGPNPFNIAGQYRPLQPAYFSLLYVVFNTTPFFYHFIQLLLHISCAVLFYILFRKFFSPGISLFMSIVFLLHPIQVESVSYIAQTASPLYTLFGLSSLLVVTRTRISTKAHLIVYFFLLMSILTKETGILFFLVILLYSFLFARKYLLRLSIGCFVTFIIYLAIRYFFGHTLIEARTLVPIADLSLPYRLLNVPLIAFHYLKTFFFPKDLAVLQQWVIISPNFLTFYLPLITEIIFSIVLLVIGYRLFLQSRHDLRVYVFFSVWFFAGLFMHLNIVPLDFTVADRFFYFPIVGLLALLMLIFRHVMKQVTLLRLLSITLAIIVIFTLALRTIIRNTDWRDNITLYTHDISISNNYLLNEMLAVEYSVIKNDTKALHHLKQSVALRPNEHNLYNLGVIYQNIGDMQNAKESYYRALSVRNYHIYPPHGHALETYMRYAASYISYENDTSKVISILDEAIADYPLSSDLRLLQALAKYKHNDKQAALNAISVVYKARNDPQIATLAHLIENDLSININLGGFPINIPKPRTTVLP